MITSKKALESVEETYCEIAVKLRDMQRKLGFVPGAKVIAITRWPELGYPSGDGVIAPYGELWRDTNTLNIPVVFSDNRLGLYKASQISLKEQ